MNKITMTLQVDHLILEALKEDISSEDVTTNSVMKEAVPGEVDLICKEDGIIAGLEIFSRVFTLLDADTKVELFCKDGDEVKKGQKMGKVTGDIRVLQGAGLHRRPPDDHRRHPGASFRRACGAELSSENERDRNLYTFGCVTS